MELFLLTKMNESKEQILVDWDDKQVKERLAEVLEDGLEVLSLN
jgi:hypothetical protein